MKVKLGMQEARTQFRLTTEMHDSGGNDVKGQPKQVFAMTRLIGLKDKFNTNNE